METTIIINTLCSLQGGTFGQAKDWLRVSRENYFREISQVKFKRLETVISLIALRWKESLFAARSIESDAFLSRFAQNETSGPNAVPVFSPIDDRDYSRARNDFIEGERARERERERENKREREERESWNSFATRSRFIITRKIECSRIHQIFEGNINSTVGGWRREKRGKARRKTPPFLRFFRFRLFTPLFSVLSILACDLSFCLSRPSPFSLLPPNLLRSSPLPTNTNTDTRFNSGTRRHTDTRLSRREIDVKKQAANATYMLETAPLYAWKISISWICKHVKIYTYTQ